MQDRWSESPPNCINHPMKQLPFASAGSAAPTNTQAHARTAGFSPPFRIALCLAAVLVLALGSAARADAPRLINLSANGPVGTGGNILIGGFVIGQGTPETVLIRAVGPSLTMFSVRFPLLNPVLSLYDSSGNQIQTNTGWTTGNATAAIMSSAGAFALPSGSNDSAIVATLPAGAYTAQIAGAGGTTGVALLEIYEVGATASTARLINLSVRGQVRTVIQTTTETDTVTIIAGFVVGGGTGSRSILVRVAGPALAQFSLQGTLADPYLNLVDAAGRPVAGNGNWGTPIGQAADAATLSAAFAQAGAFPFAPGSLDSALIESIPAGAADTALVTGDATSSNNLALVEVYDVTPE
jgi:hypothetical protein